MQPTPATAPKKGMPAIAWVGIGCGGLILVAIVAAVILFKMAAGKIKEFAANPEKTAAELIVSTNPDLKKISQDDEKGEMTIQTKDGEQVTLSYSDLAEGRITVRDKDGNETRIGSADLSKVPAWVPKAPGFTAGVSTFHSETNDKIQGQFAGKSTESAANLKTFYEAEAAKLSLGNASSHSMSASGTEVLTMKFSDDGKTLTVILTEKAGDATLVSTSYAEDK